MLLVIALEIVKKMAENIPANHPTELTRFLDIFSIVLLVLFVFVWVILYSVLKNHPEE